MLSGNRPETKEIGEDRHRTASRVQLVRMPDLRVTVPVGGVGKFERDERLIARPIVAAIALRDQAGQLGTDQGRQEFPEHDGLIVPEQLASGGVEDVRLRLARGARTIDEGIVRVHERQVHLRHDDVRVVARITDDGRPFRVSQQVASAWCREQFGRIVALEQKRMPDRTIAVETLEIQPRRPRVPQLRQIRVHLRRRPVGGDVVGDELTEKGPAGRLRRERRRFVGLVSAIA